MKIITEINSAYDLLRNYKPWGGAEYTLQKITDNGKINDFLALLDELYPDGIDMTGLNDLLAYDDNWVLSSLGIDPESND